MKNKRLFGKQTLVVYTCVKLCTDLKGGILFTIHRAAKAPKVIAAGVLALSIASTLGAQASSAGTGGKQAAAAALRPYLAPPKVIPVKVPLKKAPVKGKTFIYIQCAFSQCQDVKTGAQAAAAAVHWKFKTLSFDETNPATLVTAMKQALLYHPAVVSFNAIPESSWASEIPAYAKAKVSIVPIETGPTALSKAVITAIGDDGAVQGSILADWVVKNSNANAHVLLVNVPAFGLLATSAKGFNKRLKNLCARCTVTALNATPEQQATNAITPAVVSALQRDPSIKYVVATDGIIIPALPAALTAAGITGVKIAGGDASVENEQDVMAGTESAFVPTNFQYLGWLAVDSAARHMEGMGIAPDGGGMPEELLIKSNTHVAAESANIPTNFRAQFKALWHVG